MQVNEHQIKGCQTLAEVEGLRQFFTSFGDNEAGVDYINNWNDLLRVAEIIFNHPVKHWCGRQSAKKAFLMHIGEFSKEQAFNALVEAAEWIKQQEK